MIPKVGDGLYNNERKKMLTIMEDTTEGIHDTLIAACDKQRYEELGGGSEHRNCADNLVEGLSAISKSRFFSELRISLELSLWGGEMIGWVIRVED